MYYVYEYYIVETGEVFYVGKGKNYRYSALTSRSRGFTEVYNSNKCEVRFVKKGLSNNEALLCEKERIDELKKTNQAKRNFIDGGIEIGKEGICFNGEENGFYGRTHTEETKKKISESKIGSKGMIGKDNPMYGKGFYGKDNAMYGKTGLLAPNKTPFLITYADGSQEILLYKQCEKKFGIAFTRVSKLEGTLDYKKKSKNDEYQGALVEHYQPVTTS